MGQGAGRKAAGAIASEAALPTKHFALRNEARSIKDLLGQRVGEFCQLLNSSVVHWIQIQVTRFDCMHI